MISKEPKINEAVREILSILQVKNDQGEHFLRMLEGLIHRLITSMEDEDPDPYGFMDTAGYLVSLNNLHRFLSILAYPDDDRFD